jgi:hypothetical protein
MVEQAPKIESFRGSGRLKYDKSRRIVTSERARLSNIAESYSVSVLQRLVANYDTDRDHIGDSDLDNEQPISITFRGTLGDIRNARTALQCFLAVRNEK